MLTLYPSIVKQLRGLMSALTQLLCLHQCISDYKPRVLRAKKRSSVAAIIRIALHASHYQADTGIDKSRLPSPLDSLQCPEHALEYGQLELLLIKRAQRGNSRWSGHVAFPGGHQDPEDSSDDQLTAIRETREELGIDLTQGFLCMGRLNDRYARQSALSMTPFVFLQLTEHSPPVTLQKSEVAAYRWVPISLFQHSNVMRRGVSMDYAVLSSLSWMPRPVARCLRTDKVFFPAVRLPVPAVEAQPDGLSRPDLEFMLWGLTFAAVSELLSLFRPAIQARGLHRPMFATRNPAFNVIAGPLLNARNRRKVWFWLGIALALAVLAALVFASY